MTSISTMSLSTSKNQPSTADQTRLTFNIRAPIDPEFQPRRPEVCSPTDSLNPYNVNLQSAYNRMIRIKHRFMKLEALARKPDVNVHRLRWAIIATGSDTTYLIRDTTEFFEIMNQKKTQKIKRKEYKIKTKRNVHTSAYVENLSADGTNAQN